MTYQRIPVIGQEKTRSNARSSQFAPRPFAAPKRSPRLPISATPPSTASSIQRVFTINGKDMGRESVERVCSFLEAHETGLAEEFNSDAIDRGSDYGELSDWLMEKGLPLSIVNIASQDQPPAPELPYSTIGQVILKTGEELKINDENILALVADLDIEGSLLSAKKSSNIRGWKKDIQPLTKSWISWTSCFATADRLFNLLKTGESQGKQVNGGKEAPLRKCMWELCGSIQNSLAGIFRVKIGDSDHSFTVLVQSDRCELLQSFAGESGESLVMNAHAKKVFSASDICACLIDLCNSRTERKESSLRLFDGEVMLQGEKDLWPDLGLAWDGAPLPEATQAIKLIRDKIVRNLKVLKEQGMVK